MSVVIIIISVVVASALTVSHCLRWYAPLAWRQPINKTEMTP